MPSKYCDFIKELCPQEAQGLWLLGAPEQCDNLPAVLPGFHKGLISENLADGLWLHKSSATWQNSMVLRKKHENKCTTPLSDCTNSSSTGLFVWAVSDASLWLFFPLTTKYSLKIPCSPCIRKISIFTPMCSYWMLALPSCAMEKTRFAAKFSISSHRTNWT